MEPECQRILASAPGQRPRFTRKLQWSDGSPRASSPRYQLGRADSYAAGCALVGTSSYAQQAMDEAAADESFSNPPPILGGAKATQSDDESLVVPSFSWAFGGGARGRAESYTADTADRARPAGAARAEHPSLVLDEALAGGGSAAGASGDDSESEMEPFTPTAGFDLSHIRM